MYRVRIVLLYLAVGVLAALLLYGLTPYGAATSPDSAYYFDAANHLLAGHGLVLTNYQLAALEPYKPLTTWPPLYPVWLTAFSQQDQVNAVTAGRTAQLSFAISLIAVVILLQKIFNRVLFSLLGAAVFGLAQPILTVYVYAWSESLFINFLLITLWSALQVLKMAEQGEGRAHQRYLLGFALALLALFYCRYVGIVFAGLWPILWWLSAARMRYWQHYALASGLYGVGVVGMVLRNYVLVGDIKGAEITGAHRLDSHHALWNNLQDLGQAIQALLPTSTALTALALALGLVAGVAGVLRHDSSFGLRLGTERYRGHLWQFSLAMVAVYTVGLLILRTVTEFDRIDMRYFGSIMALAIVGGFAGVADYTDYVQRSRSRWQQGVLLAVSTAVMVILLGQGVHFYQSQLQFLRESGQVRFWAFPRQPYNNFTYAPTVPQLAMPMLQDLLVSKPQAIVTERPAHLLFLAGINPQAVPHTHFRLFPDVAVTTDTIKTLNASGKTGWLLLTNYRNSFDRLLQYYQGDLSRLSLQSQYLRHQVWIMPLPLPLAAESQK